MQTLRDDAAVGGPMIDRRRGFSTELAEFSIGSAKHYTAANIGVVHRRKGVFARARREDMVNSRVTDRYAGRKP
jgi:hypothetical protein